MKETNSIKFFSKIDISKARVEQGMIGSSYYHCYYSRSGNQLLGMVRNSRTEELKYFLK